MGSLPTLGCIVMNHITCKREDMIYVHVPSLDTRYDSRGTYKKQLLVYCGRSKLCIMISPL